MLRKARVAPGGMVLHVLNRAAGRQTLFRTPADYAAFERVMVEAHRRLPLRVLGWCLMPNHWHFVVWPQADGEVSAFFRWLTNTHSARWPAARHRVGHGPLYQGRFRSFPVQSDGHVQTVLRYVERNARSADLCGRAEAWRWGSLYARLTPDAPAAALLSDGPVTLPEDWTDEVNATLTPRELDRLQTSETRGRPFGDDAWVRRTASHLGLTHTTRREGRPSKTDEGQV